jgi:hypothetical protein
MTLRLNGSTSGYTEIDAPATGGNNTLVLPTGNGTADQALVTNGSGALSFADRGRMVRETAKASTSGTFVDFTGIPSWVKRVTVMFDGVSLNGTSHNLVQLGGSGGFETSGYNSVSNYLQGNVASGSATSTSGIVVYNGAAANTLVGTVIFTNSNANNWIAIGQWTYSNANGSTGWTAGSKTLSGTLDRIRITTVNGTDTFDAGSINILYEG